MRERLPGDVIDEKVRRIVDLILSKKARDVVVIDLQNFEHIADFFIICTADSSTHRKAIIDEIEEKADKIGISILFSDFNPQSPWNIVDTGDIVLHIFEDEARKFYDIEGLWIDAKQIKIKEEE
ncbi:MAG: ribosome silencing factor [Candidatus Calescibacterium sp.]|nr:ribosome silencing factor [Candidatus Calescibacterium sp.]